MESLMISTNASDSFTAIEYPGYVINSHKALGSLRKTSVYPKVHTSNNTELITLKFRNNQAKCQGIFGEKNAVSGVLLKITVSTSGPVAATIGSVTEVYRFKGLADHQFIYLTATNMFSNKNSRSEYSTLHLLILPPRFYESDLPLKSCDFRYKIDPKLSFNYKIPITNKKKEINNHITSPVIEILASRDHIPSVEGTPLVKIQANFKSLKELTKIKASIIFNQRILPFVVKMLFYRPIWQTSILLKKLQEKLQLTLTHTQVKKALHLCCYRFNQGPWKGLFIRRGYDPRKDVNASKYQVSTRS
jgi:general transcription factor 3C polypeptide 5 (transcription factor C subunit 1)